MSFSVKAGKPVKKHLVKVGDNLSSENPFYVMLTIPTQQQLDMEDQLITAGNILSESPTESTAAKNQASTKRLVSKFVSSVHNLDIVDPEDETKVLSSPTNGKELHEALYNEAFRIPPEVVSAILIDITNALRDSGKIRESVVLA